MAWLVAYLLGGAFTAGLLLEHNPKGMTPDQAGGCAVLVIFWPLVLAMFLGARVGRWF